MIEIEVNVSGEASAVLRRVIDSLTGPEAAELNEVGGRAAAQAAAKYHREFDQRGGWRGTGGGGRSAPPRVTAGCR